MTRLTPEELAEIDNLWGTAGDGERMKRSLEWIPRLRAEIATLRAENERLTEALAVEVASDTEIKEILCKRGAEIGRLKQVIMRAVDTLASSDWQRLREDLRNAITASNRERTVR